MISLRLPAAAFGFSTALALLSAQGALALDAESFGARLQALAEAQGAEIEWTDIAVDGDTVTLEGVTVGAAGETERVPLGELVLEGVSEEDDGFRVGSLGLESYTYADDESEALVEGVTITGLVVPGEGASADPLAGITMYESAEVDSITVTAKGAQVFSLSGLSAEITAPEGDEPFAIAASVEEFSADLSQAEDPQAREAVEALGYSTVTGRMEMAAQWQPADGRATLEQMDISIDDAGTLGVSIDLGGYTPEFAKAVQEMQTKSATASEEEKSAQGLAMLGLMQQLTFHGATIRFDDESLTGKVLDYTAAQQGMKAADVANLAQAVLPLYLAQLNNPEFSESVTAAVSAFLDNPGSFSVSAQPANPVPFALLFAGAMTAPQSLVGQLGVTVTANEAE